jgi:hypothetical protein
MAHITHIDHVHHHARQYILKSRQSLGKWYTKQLVYHIEQFIIPMVFLGDAISFVVVDIATTILVKINIARKTVERNFAIMLKFFEDENIFFEDENTQESSPLFIYNNGYCLFVST